MEHATGLSLRRSCLKSLTICGSGPGLSKPSDINLAVDEEPGNRSFQFGAVGRQTEAVQSGWGNRPPSNNFPLPLVVKVAAGREYHPPTTGLSFVSGPL